MEPIGQFGKIAKQKLDTKVSSDKKIKKEIEKKMKREIIKLEWYRTR